MTDTATHDTWIVLGASSTIAKAFTKSVAETGAHVILAGRRLDDLKAGPARFLQMLAPLMSAQGNGSIVGVGSVAGDRGRVGNYVYGAAKAGFATYLSGLRNALGRDGVHVLTVKPGPVDTAMTRGLGDQPFMTTADAVVEDIHKALRKKRNTLYTKWIWWPVMTIIKLIPEPIFKKMSI